jgi:hypothetical protein
MFTRRPARRVRSHIRASAFEALEERRLMCSPADLAALPLLPVAPAKPTVVEDVHTPVQNPGWQRPTGPIYFEGEHGHEGEPEFVLGPKWFQSGGPGTPLMLSYSYGSTLSSGLGALSAAQVRSAVEEAYQLWAAVTPLQFEQVADWGPGPTTVHYPPLPNMPVLRSEQTPIDGPGNTLARSWMPFWGTALAGDVHYDSAEAWSTHPSTGFDLLEVATHETGHALGLDHETVMPAIMNPFYAGRFSGPGTGFLLPDDIAGIQAQYGAGLGYVLNSSGTMFISGTEGANTITLQVLGGTIGCTSAGFGSFNRSAAGVNRIVINSRGGNDIVRIESNGGISTSVNTGAGDDFVDFSFGFRDLDNVTGNVDVAGGAGNDRISIFDHNNAPPATYTITSARFDRPGWGGFFYAADVESESLVTGTAADTVNVLSTFSNQPVILNSNGGNDVVNIGNGTNGMDSLGAWVQVNNTPAFTTLNLNNAASNIARTAYVDSTAGYTFIAGLAPQQVAANNADIQAINLTTGRGNDTVNVTRNSEVLNLNSGGGYDTVNVGDASAGVQLITGPVTVNNSPSYTTLSVNDAADAVGRAATIDLTTIGGAPHGRLIGLSPATIAWKIADISFTNPLRIDAGGGNDAFTVAGMADYRALTLNLGGGNDTIDLNATGASTTNLLDGGAGTDTVRVNGTSPTGPLTIAPSSGNDEVRVNFDGAGTADVLFNATQRIGSLIIGNGGTAKASSGSDMTLVTGNVNIATGGRLDLTDEDMILDYSGASPVAGLQQLLTAGYNAGGWNGSGIMSSNAAAATRTGIGYAESAEVFAGFPATFAGQAVDNTALLLKYTYYGDLNLDGTVNVQDFNRLAGNFGQTGRRWAHGDFNFDGTVNVQDFNKLAGNFGQGGLAPEGGPSAGARTDEDSVPSLEDLVARA